MDETLNPYEIRKAETLYKKTLKTGPDPIAEIEISNDGYYSCLYAINVLKAPFPLGEKTICNNSFIALEYAKNVLKSRFKLLEQNINELESNYIHMNLILKLEPEPNYMYKKYISDVLKVNHE